MPGFRPSHHFVRTALVLVCMFAPDEGDDPADVRDELQGDELRIETALAELSRNGGLPERAAVEAPFRRTTDALWEIFNLVSKGRSDQTNKASDLAARQAYVADVALQKAARRDRARSLHALKQSRLGSAGVILLLVLAFAACYVSVVRARRRILAASRTEALTDPLTGLGNRRALIADLEAGMRANEGEQTLLALFDLDGFKQYNDTFGHPAGDAVLDRLGRRLSHAMRDHGRAYRMGGDEFCILASIDETAADEIAGSAADALTGHGVGFSITCSVGYALMPAETTDYHEALRLADQRMYEHKRAARYPSQTISG